MLELKIFNDHADVNSLTIAECVEGDVTSMLVDDLRALCKQGSYACLAAPQIGINKRFFILENQIYQNPYIESLSEKSAKIFEVCENFPDKRIESVRYSWVEISYLENGQNVTKRFKDEEAQYAQFCMDWLENSMGKVVQTLKQPTVVNEVEIGRNDPCKCGSGKKYKKCCG